MRTPLLPAALAVALLLSGCVVEETAPDAGSEPDPTTDPAPWQEPAPAEPSADEAPKEPTPGAPHEAEPARTEGPVESGTDPQQVPGAWARQAITITNGYGDATLGELATGIAAGSISVLAADGDGYLVEAVLEARAASEQDARAILERTHLEHEDVLTDGTLALATFVRTDPAPTPIPVPVSIGMDATVRVTLVFTLPAALAYGLEASTASGDLAVADVRGPRVELGTASGDVTATGLTVTDLVVNTASGDIEADGIVAHTFTAGTSSGDIDADQLAVGKAVVSTASGDVDLIGAIDTLEADSSSGDLRIESTPNGSGSYDLGSASGDVTLELDADGRAYHVDAGTSSGTIVVDLADGEVIEEDERHVEAATAGYDDAKLQTSVTVSTSSGDITVQAE